jgi:hypothetical protein
MLVTLGCALGLARAEVPSGPPTFSNPLSINNTYWPFVPYRTKVHELVDGEDVTIEVFTGDTRTFTLANGDTVECRILEEWDFEDGELVEISTNHFAQADDGTVYYFGELVDLYEDGSVVSHEGSWLVGGATEPGDPASTADASAPTVFMPADPELGDVWKPEDLPDADIEEFDKAKQFVKEIEVEAGTYEDVLRVREKNPAIEFKWYAPNVGFIRGKETSDVVEMTDLVDHASAADQQDALDDLVDEITG